MSTTHRAAISSPGRRLNALHAIASAHEASTGMGEAGEETTRRRQASNTSISVNNRTVKSSKSRVRDERLEKKFESLLFRTSPRVRNKRDRTSFRVASPHSRVGTRASVGYFCTRSVPRCMRISVSHADGHTSVSDTKCPSSVASPGFTRASSYKACLPGPGG